jgi:endonuclease YncB( thermonuclease family)
VATKLSKKALISAFFIAFLYHLSAAATPLCPQISNLTAPLGVRDHVQWVVDGDTIHTRTGRKLRLLHINAPEINPKTNKPAEYYAKASRETLVKLAPKDSEIFLLYDQKRKDRYGRELALVFNAKGALINLQLVKLGASSTMVVPPNEYLWHCFRKAQKLAQENQVGLWKSSPQVNKSARNLTNERGFQWVSGTVSRVKDSNKYRWIILDEKLWIGIKRNDFQYFSKSELKFKQGDSLTVGGYLYHSYGKLRVNLRHPAMYSHD